MKKKSSRLLTVLLLLVMVVSTVACGKSNSTSGKSVMDKNHVYKESEVSFDLGKNNPNRYFVAGDRIYFQYTEYPEYDEGDAGVMPLEVEDDIEYGVEEDATEDVPDAAIEETPRGEGVITQHFVSFKLDGTDRQEFTKVFDNVDSWIQQMTVGENGDYYYITCVYDNSVKENEEYTFKEIYTLYCMDSMGNEKWSLLLSDGSENVDGEYFYLNNLFTIGDQILVHCTNGIMCIDTSGKIVKTDNPLEDCNSSYRGKDGNLILYKWGESGAEYYLYDVATGKLSEKQSVPKEASNLSAQGSGIYDLYFSGSTELYGYNFGDEALTEIMDYIDSDLSATNLNSVVSLDENRFLVSYYNDEDYKDSFSIMTKVNPEDVKEKEVLTLACYYLDYNVRKHLIDFNKHSDTYRISIKEYSIYDSFENDTYTSGTTQLNNDIIAGKVPDILVGTSDLPMAIYQSKGLLTDLYKMIDQDDTIKREDYLTNILEAYEYEGKLTCIPVSFNLITAVAKTSLVGNRMQWTISEMQSVLNGMGPDAQLFGDITRDEFLNYCMVFSGNQLIDWEKGTCSFDSAEFVDLLKFCKTLPKEINWDEKYADENYWMESQTQYRQNRTLLSYRYLNNFRTFEYCQQGDFGEEVSFIGFPTTNDIGSVISSNYTFSITNKCKNKEGAWEFIRYFLLPEYQAKSDNWPILRSTYDSLIEEAKQRPYWEDENGEKQYYDDTYWIGDTEITIQPSTDKTINQVMTLLESVNQVYYRDENWMNIVTEEAANYFEGGKSPEDVAKIIQSRVNIYVNESK